MATIPRVKKVEVPRAKSDDLKIGTLIEKSEHKWASPATARKIARDHLKENPRYYTSKGDASTDVNLVLQQNVKAVARRKTKKKSVAPQQSARPSWIKW